MLERDTHVITTENGNRTVLVLAPVFHLRIGSDRLFGEPSRSDQAIIEAVLSCRPAPDAVVYCARTRHPLGSWAFAPELSDEMLMEVAHCVLKDELALYKKLREAGVGFFAIVELGLRESLAYDIARERLRAEGKSSDELPQHTSASLGSFLATTLPGLMTLSERRAARRNRVSGSYPALGS